MSDTCRTSSPDSSYPRCTSPIQCGSGRRFALDTLTLASLFITPVFAQLPDDLKQKFDQAEQRIVRLRPSAFAELPRNLVGELQRRGCTIPQEAYTKKPH